MIVIAAAAGTAGGPPVELLGRDGLRLLRHAVARNHDATAVLRDPLTPPETAGSPVAVAYRSGDPS